MLQKRLLNVDEISAESTKANTELTRAKLSLIKGVEHDTSLMQAMLLDVLEKTVRRVPFLPGLIR